MIKPYFAVLVIVAIMLAGAAGAGEKTKTHRVVSEADVRIVSDLTYTELLSQALKKGWRYTPEQIESGYRRHFEEFKLQLIDQGYSILVGEAGA
jgi:ABC-type proline/glycine betaine transport system substrate-binding protein